MKKWTKTTVQLPPENIFVRTKVSAHKGSTLTETLKRIGSDWIDQQGKKTAYRPTYWQEL